MKSHGAKPMNIEWRLEEPMPAYLWRESVEVAALRALAGSEVRSRKLEVGSWEIIMIEVALAIAGHLKTKPVAVA